MKKSLFLSIFFLFFILCHGTSSASASSEELRQLQQKLEMRDKIILELLERVEQLERRVGVGRPAESPPASVHEEQPEALQQDPDQPRGLVVVEEGAEERALERAL